MKNIIIDLQNFDTWTIQLTIAVNFISSIGTGKERVMHSKSDNMKCRPYNDANEVDDKLIDSTRSRYQNNLEISMNGSDFIFDSVHVMYYKCHKVNFRRGCSYIGYPDWIKKKKATINPKNEDD